MKVISLLLAVSLASSANSQSTSPQREPPGQRLPIYLSLMGEPFRGVTGGPQPITDWFAVADRDHDGAVSLREMLEDGSRFFKTLDVDGNGVISPIEMTRYETDVAPARVRFDGGLRPFRSADKSDNLRRRTSDDGLPSEGRGRRSSRDGSERLFRDLEFLEVPQPVMMADADFDQRVSADEFSKTASKRFSRNDKNKDGYLQLSELTPFLNKKGKPVGTGQVW